MNTTTTAEFDYQAYLNEQAPDLRHAKSGGEPLPITNAGSLTMREPITTVPSKPLSKQST